MCRRTISQSWSRTGPEGPLRTAHPPWSNPLLYRSIARARSEPSPVTMNPASKVTAASSVRLASGMAAASAWYTAAAKGFDSRPRRAAATADAVSLSLRAVVDKSSCASVSCLTLGGFLRCFVPYPVPPNRPLPSGRPPRPPRAGRPSFAASCCSSQSPRSDSRSHASRYGSRTRDGSGSPESSSRLCSLWAMTAEDSFARSRPDRALRPGRHAS